VSESGNWFFGLPVDGSLLARLPPPPSGLRLVHPDDLHLTLAFLGPCPEARAERALEELDRRWPSVGCAAFEVRLGAVVPLGAARRYSALSALLEQGREQAERLIAALRDGLCQAAGARTDARPPKAHLTLARPERDAPSAARQAGLEWARTLDLTAAPVRIDRIALYGRAAGGGGRRYRAVHERRLSTGTRPPASNA
jgi:2'-5' RNA ligase